MNALVENLDKLSVLRELVKSHDEKYMHHTVLKNREITSSTISIVMTSHNRTKQLHFTLQTIMNSRIKDVQIILVDDSDTDPVKIKDFENYPFYMDIIQIKRDQKIWHNPCVNYNIGFSYIKGSTVVIQNSEVCHVGDVLAHITNTLSDDMYYVFDVKATNSYDSNEIVYKNGMPSVDIFNKNGIYHDWFQHSTLMNRQFHFLCALTYSSFCKIEGFSYDYAFGQSFDDDDLVFKIALKSVTFNSVANEEFKVGGIHLFHGSSTFTGGPSMIESNRDLFNKKIEYFQKYGHYIELSADTVTNKHEKYILLVGREHYEEDDTIRYTPLFNINPVNP